MAQYSESNPAPYGRTSRNPDGTYTVTPQNVVTDPQHLLPDRYIDDTSSTPYTVGAPGVGVKPSANSVPKNTPDAPTAISDSQNSVNDARVNLIQAQIDHLNSHDAQQLLKDKDQTTIEQAAKLADDIKNADYLVQAKKDALGAAVKNAATKAGLDASVITKNAAATAWTDARTKAAQESTWFKFDGESQAIDDAYVHGDITAEMRDKAKKGLADSLIEDTIRDMSGSQRATADYQQGELANAAIATQVAQRGQDLTAATTQRGQDLSAITSGANNIAQYLSPAGAFHDAQEFNKVTADPSYKPQLTGSAGILYNPTAISASNYASYGPPQVQPPAQIAPPPGMLTGAQAAAHVAAQAQSFTAPQAGPAPAPAPVSTGANVETLRSPYVQPGGMGDG